jgi:hypothetical protein
MWPFRTRRSIFVAQSEKCRDEIAARWIVFRQKLNLNRETTNDEIFLAFAIPITNFVEISYPLILKTGGEGFVTFIILHAVRSIEGPAFIKSVCEGLTLDDTFDDIFWNMMEHGAASPTFSDISSTVAVQQRLR